MVKRVHHVRPAHPPCEGAENTHFSATVRNNFVREASILEVLCACSSLQVRNYSGNCCHLTGISQVQWKYLYSGWQGPPRGPLNCQRQGEYHYHNGQWSQSSNQNSLTPKDLWHQLVNHGISRSEIDLQSTKFWLDFSKQTSSSLSDKSLT